MNKYLSQNLENKTSEKPSNMATAFHFRTVNNIFLEIIQLLFFSHSLSSNTLLQRSFKGKVKRIQLKHPGNYP